MMRKIQRGAIGEARRSLEDAPPSAAEAPRQARAFTRRADWLRERFPDVEGMVKLVDRGAVESHDWSLTPGRYVGVAPEEKDKDSGGCRSNIYIKINKLRNIICGDTTFCQESGTDEFDESVCTIPHPCIYRPKPPGSAQFETCTHSGFDEAIRGIRIELEGLNEEVADRAITIARNFEELGI